MTVTGPIITRAVDGPLFARDSEPRTRGLAPETVTDEISRVTRFQYGPCHERRNGVRGHPGKRVFALAEEMTST